MQNHRIIAYQYWLLAFIVVFSCKGKKEVTNHIVSDDSATIYLSGGTITENGGTHPMIKDSLIKVPGRIYPSNTERATKTFSDSIVPTEVKTIKGAKTFSGIYVQDGFKSNLRYIDMVEEGVKMGSIFEIIIENAASRDTSGNWKIYDSKKALEVLWQLYLTQIHDKIKITK